MNAIETFVTEHILKPLCVKHGFTEIPTVTINYPYETPHDFTTPEIERELLRSLGVSEELLAEPQVSSFPGGGHQENDQFLGHVNISMLQREEDKIFMQSLKTSKEADNA